MAAPLPLPGDRFSGLIGGKYRVVSTIAVGGMGIVYEAENTRTHGRVALKVLSDEAKLDDASRIRFAREARASGRLRSRHVARVLDVDVLDDQTPYIVMELLDGRDLSREIKERPPLPLAEAASIVVQVAAGVAEAHAAGIVHRDLKPGNVFLADEGAQRIAKVLDFGISKMPVDGEDASELTCTFATVGTPAYMSPEQIRRPRDVDAATDVWSLGVLTYRLLAGRVPFTGNASSVAVSICNDTPLPLSTVRDDVPADVAALVDAALHKDKTQRPTIVALAEGLAKHVSDDAFGRVAREALAEIHRLVAASPRAVTRGEITAAPPTLAATLVDPTVADAQPASARLQASAGRRTASIVAIIALLALVSTGAVVATRASKTTPDATARESAPSPVTITATPRPSAAQSASAAPAPLDASAAPSAGSSPVAAKPGVGSKGTVAPRPKPPSNATASAAPLPPRF